MSNIIVNPGGQVRTFRHGHLFCGVGAGAKGFNNANPRAGPLRGNFECAGGIDVDAGAIANFERMTGVRGTVLDLFDEEQYEAFHDRPTPAGWREAGPDDVYRAFGPDLDVIFTSAPCKGFSGLLSATKSKTDKYQALNRLTVRGIWLTLEAYKHDPVSIILFENVPRIMTRGGPLLEEIKRLLRAYGYIVNDDTAAIHDCGEIGNLAQTRKRYLLVARHPLKIPPFIYQPDKHRLRGVGEVLEKLPLPGDPIGGVHHRVPMLQWMTWVRLAMVEAGKDWRSLNRLRVKDGVLQDYGLVPEFETGKEWRDNVLGVLRWADHASHLVGNQRSPLHGRVSIADPRPVRSNEYQGDYLGVRPWDQPSGVISTRGGPTNGAYAIADVRVDSYLHHGALGVKGYEEAAGVVTAACRPANGPHSLADPRPGYGPKAQAGLFYVVGYDQRALAVTGAKHPAGAALSLADPRIDGHAKSIQLGVRAWGRPAPCLKGDVSVGGGPYAIADVRMGGRPRFNNTYRIVCYAGSSPSVPGPGGPGGGLALADPRAPDSPLFKKNKYKVTPYAGAAGSVIGASSTGDGAFAIADPRGPLVGDSEARGRSYGKYPVAIWIGPSRAVIGGRDQGAYALADPRPEWGAGRHENVMRVTPASQPTGTVPANAHSVTGGHPCVADERCGELPAKDLETQPFALPAPTQKIVCRIIAEDGTWHRPFTTLELAGLQSLFDPEEAFHLGDDGSWMLRSGFELIGGSDAMVREWIGNAVPSAAAQGMAEAIGEALLLAAAGENAFKLDSRPIWARPYALALAVDSRQPAFDMDGGLI